MLNFARPDSAFSVNIIIIKTHDSFKFFIEKNALFRREDRLLVAVSGGVDSMVLCDLLIKSGYCFSVVHCNFQLRGVDSDDDELFVTDFCVRHNISSFIRKFDTLDIVRAEKKSIQETARDLRYAYFAELLAENITLKYIITAHHASDNVETVLYRLAKGTGLKGLTGIAAKDEQRRIVRPLLFAFKNDITDYARENNITYREDISNKSDKYRRNYVRHHIVPAFENINPSFEKTFAHGLGIFNTTFAFYKQGIAEQEKKYVRQNTEQTVINWEALNLSVHKNILLYEFLLPYNFNADQTEQIISVLEKENESGKKFFSETHDLLLNRKKIIIREKISKKASRVEADKKEIILKIFFQKDFKKDFENNFQKDFIFGNEKIVFAVKIISGKINFQEKKPDNKFETYLDADCLNSNFCIRLARKGDRFQPSGMNGQSKLLSDFFRSLKLSEFDKQKQLLLTDADDKIIWIVGLRADERFKITENSKAVIRLQFSVTPEI